MKIQNIQNHNFEYKEINHIKPERKLDLRDEAEISDISNMLSKLKKIKDIREDKISDIQKKIKTNEILQPPNVRNGILRMLVMMGHLPNQRFDLK